MAAITLAYASEVTKVPYGTLRYWASHHRWPVHDQDKQGRNLYEARLIAAHAEAWLARREAAA